MASLLPPVLHGISGKSRHAAKCINNMFRHLQDHTIFRRGETVFGALERSIIPVCLKLLVASNRIDRDITRGMLYAEKTCCHPDCPPWSEALHLASKAVRLWKTFISGIRKATYVSAALSSICADLAWESTPSLPLKAAKLELKQAETDLKDCRAHAVENRQQFLSKLINAAALQEDISREKALKRQLHVEAMKSCYQKLCSTLRPAGLRGGITKVEVKVNGSVIAYTKQSDIHREPQQESSPF
jgi:hypothetical protein